MKLTRYILFVLVLFVFHAESAFAQPGFHVDIAKPKPYENRKLKAERTGDGKLKGVKRIWQNLTTHYNYVFNASNKFSEILEKAKEQHKDDYTQLLSFYNYDLNATAADSAQLDSVIYKARTGILNHDLRTDWGDELYLLWAASWHLEKKFDSAALLLQFINYAYAPQDEDGYYKYIGTHTAGAREVSLVSKEEDKFLHDKTFSRNDAFIWRIRTLIELDDLTAAGSLITTLRRDPAFPPRLENDLDEVTAYWHFKQERWDSAAVHLLAALDGDYPKMEKARWTYLVAQMLEKAGKKADAINYFGQVVAMTPDPVMEVYARLNLVRLGKEEGEGAIDKNVADLLKMAKKDKYEDFRDIIYAMAAQMELERNNIDAATALLIKGSKFNNGNQASRNKAFLQIADVLFDQKKYAAAASFYDSVQVTDLAEADARRVAERKPGLAKIVFNSGVVYRQDSLQHLAALPADERDAILKKALKRMRKEQGLKEEVAAPSAGGISFPSSSSTAAQLDLFSTPQKGDWYFYNNAAKAQGIAQFKATWGNRPNVDNWRRYAAVNQQVLTASPDRVVDVANPNALPGADGNAGNDLSMEGLLSRLPSTPEMVKASNDSISAALYTMGESYLNDLEDYPSAITIFEELRRRFPQTENMDAVLFNLAFAYGKTGKTADASQAKKALADAYPQSRYAAIASTGKDPEAKQSPEATKAYENVYNLFVEGQFAEAENAKRIADSTYKTTYWQPQLLYIEAVYYIRQREDSIAKNALGTIISQHENKALTEKAQNLLSVLGRRQEIEDELTRLQITRPSDEDSSTTQPIAYQKPVEKKDTVEKIVAPKPAIDSVALARQAGKERSDSIALAKATQKQLADSLAQAKAMAKRTTDSLEQVKRDSVALAKKEAAQALRDSLARKALAAQQARDSIASVKAKLAQQRADSIALARAIQNQAKDSTALSKYLAKRRVDSLARITRDSVALAKKEAAQALRDSLARKALAAQQVRDSIASARVLREQLRKDSIAFARELARRRSDSLALLKPPARPSRDTVARKPVVSPLGYTYNPAEAHYVAVVMEKVDPIFVNEAKNAFFRYNKENYYNEPLDVQIVNLTADTRLLLITGLPDAAAATAYAAKAKSLAASEIIPWLTGNKYTFSIISPSNLEVLKARSEFGGYRKFLEQQLPGKF